MFSLFCKVKRLPSIQHLAWKVILNRVPTKENWKSKGVMIDNVFFPVCILMEQFV